MIGVGIVGCNYGRTVLVPAFHQDPRCEVVALAGTDTARTAELARAANVASGPRVAGSDCFIKSTIADSVASSNVAVFPRGHPLENPVINADLTLSFAELSVANKAPMESTGAPRA